MIASLHCPLCGTLGAVHFHRDSRREYLRCMECSLVFVPPGYYLGKVQEKAEYDLHQNRPDDPGYRRFLSRLAGPLLERIPAGARGLDFGCGPGPALAAMLVEAGCEVNLYDVFYRPQTEVLNLSYQFITATEVVEHLHEPGAELARLWQMLEPGGYLGVMTKLVIDAAAFTSWHYKNDPTHICFFSDTTWKWWAGHVGARWERIGADVTLLQKP
jgi:hypothetical protein